MIYHKDFEPKGRHRTVEIGKQRRGREQVEGRGVAERGKEDKF